MGCRKNSKAILSQHCAFPKTVLEVVEDLPGDYVFASNFSFQKVLRIYCKVKLVEVHSRMHQGFSSCEDVQSSELSCPHALFALVLLNSHISLVPLALGLAVYPGSLESKTLQVPPYGPTRS